MSPNLEELKSSFHWPFPQITKQQGTVQFWADIEFGVLRKNCKNFGICKIHQYPTAFKNLEKTCNCNKAFSGVFISPASKVEIVFFKSLLDKKIVEKYFSNNTFQMDQNFEMPLNMTAHLSKKPLEIKAGLYPIFENKAFFIIQFNQMYHFKNREP